ncbi:hypothetical protein B1218_37685, partial [Pseudomonas ogarae]
MHRPGRRGAPRSPPHLPPQPLAPPVPCPPLPLPTTSSVYLSLLAPPFQHVRRVPAQAPSRPSALYHAQ